MSLYKSHSCMEYISYNINNTNIVSSRSSGISISRGTTIHITITYTGYTNTTTITTTNINIVNSSSISSREN